MLRKFTRILAAMALVLGGVYGCFYAVVRDRCTVTDLTEAMSPDGAWKAVEDETFCASLFLTHIVTGVRLVSTRDPARSAYILGTPAATDDERPNIAWTAPRALQVKVPSSFGLKVLACEFDDVRIEIKVQPDDSANRAVWYRQLGKPDPDPGGLRARKCPANAAPADPA